MHKKCFTTDNCLPIPSYSSFSWLLWHHKGDQPYVRLTFINTYLFPVHHLYLFLATPSRFIKELIIFKILQCGRDPTVWWWDRLGLAFPLQFFGHICIDKLFKHKGELLQHVSYSYSNMRMPVHPISGEMHHSLSHSTGHGKKCI